MKKALREVLALAGLAMCIAAIAVTPTHIVTIKWLGHFLISGSIGAAALKIAAPWNYGRGNQDHASNEIG